MSQPPGTPWTSRLRTEVSARHVALALGVLLVLQIAGGLLWTGLDGHAPHQDDAYFLNSLWNSTRLALEAPLLAAAGRMYFFMGEMAYPPGLNAAAAAVALAGVPFPWNAWVALLLFMALLGAATFRAGLLLGGPRVGWLAALLALSSPLALEYGRRAFLDLPIAAEAALALALVLESRGLSRRGPCAALGLLLGLAFLTKWQGLAAFLPLLWLGTWIMAESPWRAAAGAAGVLAVAAASLRASLSPLPDLGPLPRLLAWGLLTGALFLAGAATRRRGGDTALRLANLLEVLATASATGGAFLFAHWNDFAEAIPYYAAQAAMEGAWRVPARFWQDLYFVYRDELLIPLGACLVPLGLLVGARDARRDRQVLLVVLLFLVQGIYLASIGNLQPRYLLLHLPVLALLAALPVRGQPLPLAAGLVGMATLTGLLQIHGWMIADRFLGTACPPTVIRGIGLVVPRGRQDLALPPQAPVLGWGPGSPARKQALEQLLDEVDRRRRGRPVVVEIQQNPLGHVRMDQLNLMAARREVPVVFLEESPVVRLAPSWRLDITRIPQGQEGRPPGPGSIALDRLFEMRLVPARRPPRYPPRPDEIQEVRRVREHFLDCRSFSGGRLKAHGPGTPEPGPGPRGGSAQPASGKPSPPRTVTLLTEPPLPKS